MGKRSIPEGYVQSMRGVKKSQPQVRELDLSTTRYILIPPGKNPLEMERMELHLELMDAKVGEEEGGYGKPKCPPEGSTHFWHAGYLVMNERGVWSYCTLDDPEVPRGSFARMGQADRQLVNYVRSGHLAPPLSEVKIKEEGGLREKNVYRQAHESFGLARISTAGSGGDGTFFGSRVRHRSSVSLEVSRATIEKEVGHESIYRSSPLLKIEMSAAQFTELLTSQGKGTGVPVTIRRVMNRGMPNVPPLQSMRELITEEVTDELDKVGAHLDEMRDFIKENESKLGKTRAKTLLLKLDFARANITRGLPYIHNQVVKSCEKTVADATASIEATYNIVTRHLGEEALKALGSVVPGAPELPGVLPALPEHTEEKE